MEHHDSDLQSALDSELTSGQAAQLAERLKQPQVNQEFEVLKNVDRELKNIEMVPPPPGLRSEVMRQIRLRAAIQTAPSVRVRSWSGRLWASIRDTRPAFQLGLGFALGVLVLSPFVLRSGLVIDPGQAVGTLSSPGRLSRVLEISGPGISGELLRGSVQGIPTLELRLSSEGPVDAQIELGAPVRLVSWESAGPVEAARYESGTFEIRHEGSGTYHLKLSEMADEWPPTRVVVSAAGRPLFEETIP